MALLDNVHKWLSDRFEDKFIHFNLASFYLLKNITEGVLNYLGNCLFPSGSVFPFPG